MIQTVQLPTGVYPQFGLLYDIIIHGQEQNIIFIYLLLETVKYNTIFGAYEVVPLPEYRCLYRSSIQCYHPFSAIDYGDSTCKYIKSKYDLTVYCNYTE